MKNVFLGIDIGSGSVKMVLMSKQGSSVPRVMATAVEMFEKPMDFDTKELPPLLLYFIKKFLRRHKLGRIGVGFSIAGQSAFVRLAKIPAVAPNKIEQIVLYETQQQVPFPIRDVVWDYQILAREEKRLQVLIAALKKDFVAALGAVAEQAGVIIEIIDINVLALYNCAAHYVTALDEVLIIDIGAKATNVLSAAGHYFLTRSIPLGEEDIVDMMARRTGESRAVILAFIQQHRDVLARDLHESEQPLWRELQAAVRTVFTDIAGEIIKTINYFSGQEEKKIGYKKALLAGGAVGWQASEVFFEQSLMFPVERLELRTLVDVAGNGSGSYADALGPAIGVALRGFGPQRLQINLCSPEQKSVLGFQQKKNWIIANCLLGCFFSALLFAAAGTMLTRQRESGAVIRQQIHLFETRQDALRQTEHHLRVLQQTSAQLLAVLRRQFYVISLLDVLERTLPPPVWLTYISVDVSTQSALVGGMCEKTLAEISAMQAAMQQSPLTAQVTVETVAEQDTGLLAFTLRVLLAPQENSREL